ncbi:armadillo-type protein [Mycena sp. CBHHK59/15]|nr:armadillo-type protein [Mycena sp. CBHHK59/15]
MSMESMNVLAPSSKTREVERKSERPVIPLSIKITKSKHTCEFLPTSSTPIAMKILRRCTHDIGIAYRLCHGDTDLCQPPTFPSEGHSSVAAFSAQQHSLTASVSITTQSARISHPPRNSGADDSALPRTAPHRHPADAALLTCDALAAPIREYTGVSVSQWADTIAALLRSSHIARVSVSHTHSRRATLILVEPMLVPRAHFNAHLDTPPPCISSLPVPCCRCSPQERTQEHGLAREGEDMAPKCTPQYEALAGAHMYTAPHFFGTAAVARWGPAAPGVSCLSGMRRGVKGRTRARRVHRLRERAFSPPRAQTAIVASPARQQYAAGVGHQGGGLLPRTRPARVADVLLAPPQIRCIPSAAARTSGSRPWSLRSTQSWWSDSNPPGATISLHALAKPVMKGLYHRQVLGFIAKNRGSRLSKELVEICISYLVHGRDVQAAAFQTLIDISTQLDGAQAIVDAHALGLVPQLLDSPAEEVLQWTCDMLGEIAWHKTLTGAILDVKPCVQLASLVSHHNILVQTNAIYALANISNHLDGAHTVVDAHALDLSPQLLDSPAEEVLQWTCHMLGEIAWHKTLTGAILDVKPCVQLVSLASHHNILVQTNAIYALAKISNRLDGAHTVVDAYALNLVPQLLDSPAEEVLQWTCDMLGEIACHKTLTGAILDVKPCVQLVSLASHHNIFVRKLAIYALANISTQLDSASTIVDAHVLDLVPQLLDSPAEEVLQWTCEMLGQIAWHKTLTEAILDVKPCVQLVSLALHHNIVVQTNAIFALANISGKLDGAQAVIDAHAMDLVPQLLDSPAEKVLQWTCNMLGQIAWHKTLTEAILDVKPCVRLVSLAFQKLDGAQAIIDAHAMDLVPQLLDSPAEEVLQWTCNMLGQIAWHKTLTEAILDVKPCVRLVSLALHHNILVQTIAISALANISQKLDGAQAIIDAHAMDLVPQLLDSMAEEVLQWTCNMLGHIACHETLTGAILDVKPCVRLVSLALHHNTSVQDEAIYALANISRKLDGAQAIIDAHALDLVPQLLDSPAEKVLQWTCNMLGQIAWHKILTEAILDVKPCAQFVSMASHHDIFVRKLAIYALANISTQLDSASTIVDAHVLDLVPQLLDSPAEEVLQWTCNMLGHIACHETLTEAILDVKPCVRLVSLALHHNISVQDEAIYALANISAKLDGAQAVIDAHALDLVPQLLDSPAEKVLQWTCNMLGQIAWHKTLTEAILDVKPCVRLVSLALHNNTLVKYKAIYALAKISQKLDGAQAIIDAHAMDLVPQLLDSPAEEVLQWTCNMLGQIAWHKTLTEAILDVKPCVRLVSLALHHNILVQTIAISALANISQKLDGAQAIIDAHAMDLVPQLLDSMAEEVLQWTCNMLGHIACHETLTGAILDVKPCVRLVSLALHHNTSVQDEAIYALANISRKLDGAQAIIDAHALDLVPQLLDSPAEKVLQWTCNMLGQIAWHKILTEAILDVKPCAQFVSMASHHDIFVRKLAIYALANISTQLDSASTIVDAHVLDLVPQLLDSPAEEVLQWTCNMLGHIACHETLTEAILDVKPCVRLVSLALHHNISVQDEAIYALANISAKLDGAQAVIDAHALDLVPQLLDSPAEKVLQWTCNMLGQIAWHKTLTEAILDVKPCVRLVSLALHNNTLVKYKAIYALAKISQKLDGAQAIIDAHALDLVPQLLDSPAEEVLQWTCNMLGQIAWHKTLTEAILDVKPCVRLVSLALHHNILVQTIAISALANISQKLDGAQAIIDAHAMDLVPQLLDSMAEEVLQWTCNMLGHIACHETLTGAILDVKPCVRLVSLALHHNTSVQDEAIYALANISRKLDGAQAIIDAHALDLVPQLLDSPAEKVLQWTCNMLGQIAWHKILTEAILDVKPCAQFVSMASHHDIFVRKLAIYALANISTQLDSASTIVDAHVLDLVPQLLDSPAEEVLQWTCNMLGHIACHETLTEAILDVKPCVRLVSLALHHNISVQDEAIYALANISAKLDGAQAVIDAHALDLVPQLLDSPAEKVLQWTCNMLGQIAWHKTLTEAILDVKPCVQLVSLALHHNIVVQTNAIFALANISGKLDGAQAVIDAHAMDLVPQLLDSPAEKVLQWTCNMLGQIAWHKTLTEAILDVKPCVRLVSLALHNNTLVKYKAIYALAKISQKLDGAQAIIDAHAMDLVPQLLDSPAEEVLQWTCNMLGHIACHETLTEAILDVKPCVRLVSLALHHNTSVQDEAIYALANISRKLDGAQAIIDAHALDLVPQLLDSPAEKVLQWTCDMLGEIACHKTLTGAILDVKPCVQLVSLALHHNIVVQTNAIYALANISGKLDGAQAVIDAHAMDLVPQLLDSPAEEVLQWTCDMLGEIAWHKTLTGAILDVKPCVQLVSLALHQNISVQANAIDTLACISRHLDGACAVVDAHALDLVPHILDLDKYLMQTQLCEMIGHIACHTPLTKHVANLKLCLSLVAALRGSDNCVQQMAYYALESISTGSENGALVVAEAQLLGIHLPIHSNDLD